MFVRLKVLAVLIGFATILCGGAAHSDTVTFASAGASRAAPSAVAGFPRLYQSVKTVSCLATNTCQLIFDRVRTNHVLHATHLNCFAVPTVQNPNVVEQVTITLFTGNLSNPSTVKLFDHFVPPSDNVHPFRFGVNETISTFFEDDTRPRIAVSTGGMDANISFFCNLTGTLLRP